MFIAHGAEVAALTCGLTSFHFYSPDHELLCRQTTAALLTCALKTDSRSSDLQAEPVRVRRALSGKYDLHKNGSKLAEVKTSARIVDLCFSLGLRERERQQQTHRSGRDSCCTGARDRQELGKNTSHSKSL